MTDNIIYEVAKEKLTSGIRLLMLGLKATFLLNGGAIIALVNKGDATFFKMDMLDFP